MSGLLAIGWPVYQSWSMMVADYFSAVRKYGQLGGFELLVPLAAALLVASFVRPTHNAPY
jgi:hypothetical protein